MMSSPSLTNGAQDLYENLLCIGDAAFPGLSNQDELNWVGGEGEIHLLYIVALQIEC